MRKVIVSNLVSLDGFFEGPNGDWFVVDEEFFEYARNLLRTVDTILFGRATYQQMAGYWPSAPAEEIADEMNNLSKVVFSRSLHTVEWSNSRLASDDAVEEVAKLKQMPGKDMVILGSATLASSLLQAGLIDEYRVPQPRLDRPRHRVISGHNGKIETATLKNTVLRLWCRRTLLSACLTDINRCALA